MEYDKKFTIFRGAHNWTPPDSLPKDQKITVISKSQPLNITYFDEENSSSSAKTTVMEGESQTPILSINTEKVEDELYIQNNEQSQIRIVQPLEHNASTMFLHTGRGKLPILLPKELFIQNEPIHIMAGTYKLPTVNSLPHGSEMEDADPDKTMVLTEVPASNIQNAGLSEGSHELDAEKHKEFIKSICANVIGGGAGGIVNNYDLLREFFPNKKFYIKKTNGKYYVIFKGLAGTRKNFNGTIYSIKNPRVMALGATQGAGTGLKAAANGLKSKSMLKGNILTVAIIGVVDLAAWHKGMLSDDGKYLSDLLVEFGLDVGKAAISTVAASIIVGAFCVFFGVATASVVVVVGAGIVVGILFGIGLDYLDKQTGFSDSLRNHANQVEKSIVKSFDDIFIDPLLNFFIQLENHILWYYKRNNPHLMN